MYNKIEIEKQQQTYKDKNHEKTQNYSKLHGSNLCINQNYVRYFARFAKRMEQREIYWLPNL